MELLLIKVVLIKWLILINNNYDGFVINKEIENYDVVLDSIGKINQELVTNIKGSVVTIEKLIKNKTISEQDKKEALQWLDQ